MLLLGIMELCNWFQITGQLSVHDFKALVCAHSCHYFGFGRSRLLFCSKKAAEATVAHIPCLSPNSKQTQLETSWQTNGDFSSQRDNPLEVLGDNLS